MVELAPPECGGISGGGDECKEANMGEKEVLEEANEAQGILALTLKLTAR